MNVKAIVFDLDGTLVDSGRMVTAILNSIRSKLGKPELPLNEFLPWLSLGGEQLITHALEVSGSDVKIYLGYFRQQYFELQTPVDSLYAGVADVLSVMNAKDYLLSICTNKPRRLAQKVLIETGIMEYFSFICAGDDLPTRKPHQDNLKACMDCFGLAPYEGIVVGDSSVDQCMANKLGMPFYFHRNGYDDGVKLEDVNYTFESYIELLTEIVGYE